MANYFVINSKFKPYSFDELIKPYQMYGQAYQEQEALIDAAKEKEFSPAYLNKEQDAEAYALYDEATRGLQAVSDELATKGLSSALRGKLRTAAKDYKSTMDALTVAQAQLMQERDRRAKAGDDYVYQQDSLRIGDFLGGATPNQKSAKLSNIADDIATEFAQRAKGISDDTWRKAMDSNGNVIGGYYDVTTETGLTAAQLDTILADDEKWNQIIATSALTNDEVEQLQRFRNVVNSKKNAVGYNDYSDYNRARIDDAIFKGASAGLMTTSHQYKQDPGFHDSAWNNYLLNREKHEDDKTRQAELDKQAKLAAEEPYTHSDETNPSIDNRTGFKPGYSIKNGKLQYSDPNAPESSSSSSSSGSSATYTTTTGGIRVHTKDGTKSFTNIKEAREDKDVNKRLKDLKTIAIEDIDDPDIQRELLSRINISTLNINDIDLPALIAENLQRLNQITVQVGGTKGEKDYVWTIEDKDIHRLTGETPSDEDDKDVGI